MSMWEFRSWQAMYRIEPFGDDWLQAAVITAKIHNVNCKEKIKPRDVIPAFHVAEQSVEEQMHLIDVLSAGLEAA